MWEGRIVMVVIAAWRKITKRWKGRKDNVWGDKREKDLKERCELISEWLIDIGGGWGTGAVLTRCMKRVLTTALKRVLTRGDVESSETRGSTRGLFDNRNR